MTNNVFQDIESQIDIILDSAKEYYSPSDGIVDDVVIKVFIELIPTIRDMLFFDPDGVLIYLEKHKDEHRLKYNNAEKNSTNNTTEFDEDSFSRSQDDKFFHGVLIKITDLIASKIRSSKVSDNTSTAETTGVIQPKKLKAKHYVLAYMFDLLVSDKQPPLGQQTYLENEIGNRFNAAGFNGHTFQRLFRDSQNKYDINSRYQIEDYFDIDWRDKIKEVFDRESTNEDSPLLNKWSEIDNYLKSNDL